MIRAAFEIVKSMLAEEMVWVYKTNVRKERTAKKLGALLTNCLPPGSKWNFDLEDCDKILRIVCDMESAACIHTMTMKLLHDNGFLCELLED